MVTGNLEGNFNKLEFFFDTVPGGENSLSATPHYDFPDNDKNVDWNSQRLSNILNPSVGPGMTFDTGFEVDYHLFVRRGFAADFPPNFNALDLDFIDRMGGTSQIVNGNANRVDFDFDNNIGSGVVTSTDLANNAGAAAIANDIEFALDNTNEAGVSGDCNAAVDTAAAEAVTTGVEFSIDVADLGMDPQAAGTIKICVVLNGSNHDFLSNQILPGVDSPTNTSNDCHLGGDNDGVFIGDLAGIDFNAWTGDQFASIDYSPGGDCAFELGDVNEDGEVDLLDVAPFVVLLSKSGFVCQADINGDGNLDLLDVNPFVELLAGG